MSQSMSYFRTRMHDLSNEYKGRNKATLIAAAGRCQIPDCGRRAGDVFVFGPTHYLKKRIRFKVRLHVHVVDGATMGFNKVVLCSGCHMAYHLFNRLEEEAMFGKTISETTYTRCRKCLELSCRCCQVCVRAPKKCRCKCGTCGELKAKCRCEKKKKRRSVHGR